MEGESYSSSSKTRPEKNLSGSYSNYCCIPGCTSAFYNSNREKTGISLFSAPAKDPERKRWLRIISNLRRRGEADSWRPIKRLYVRCTFVSFILKLRRSELLWA